LSGSQLAFLLVKLLYSISSSRRLKANGRNMQDGNCFLLENLWSTDVILVRAGNFHIQYLNNFALYICENG
jgi:hypothetical protein